MEVPPRRDPAEPRLQHPEMAAQQQWRERKRERQAALLVAG
jgi:hypothetical protein